jgi:hypothetical protein
MRTEIRNTEHEMDAYSIKFDGRVLDRGFWLYVIDIATPLGRRLYVGRTGDSSSAKAASPFSRISQHLDARPNAKGNALARNLREAGIDPAACSIEMIAVGPIFPEEKDFPTHRVVRDKVGALEKGLAQHLREHGYTVLGTHASSVPPDPSTLADVTALVETRLKNRRPHNHALHPTGDGGFVSAGG